MSVDALAVWKKLAGAEKCREAMDFYAGQYPIDTDISRRQEILGRGAADFDQKYRADDRAEKPWYKTEYYVGPHGYMDMHIKQNLAAFRHCFKDGMPQPLLFVDFGCGPMTAGLALAGFLSGEMPGYKKQATYIGVDVSQNMVDKAEAINRAHRLFAPARFAVVCEDRIHRWILPHSPPGPVTAVLCLSFVLAPDTWKSGAQKNNTADRLAKAWRRYTNDYLECRETKIIYLNPPSDSLHRGWNEFKHVLLASSPGEKFCYTPGGLSTFPVKALRGREVAYEIICGTPK